MSECNHQKVYADYILASNPPQTPWICSICGEKGLDRGLLTPPKATYAEIVELFKPKPSVPLAEGHQ